MQVRIAVLASGGGTNLQAIIDFLSARGEDAPGRVVLVAANRADAPALARARAASLPAETFNAGDDGAELIALLRRYRIDLVVLAGYLKRVPPAATAAYKGRIINVHPGLLPEFGGAGMYGAKVHSAVIASKSRTTGVTAHFVDDEYDHGPVIAQWRVRVNDGDTPETLAARVLEVEHILYPRVVEMIAALHSRDFVADF